MNRRGIVTLSIGAFALLLFGAAVVARSVAGRVRHSLPTAKAIAPDRAEQDSRVAARTRALDAVKSVNHVTQGSALHDAALLGLIRNARIAARRGDAATRGAMVNGLKKEPVRARQLIEQEKAKSVDGVDTQALNGLITELP